MEEEKEITVAAVIEWCDKQVEEGREIKLVWDGGGDSGWCHFQIDGGDARGPEIDWLIDKMDSELDYGSWAGEFFASGEALYDSETKVFQGEDTYTEDQGTEIDAEFVITVPAKFNNFDALVIRTESEECNTEVSLIVRNGIKHPDKTTWEKSLEETCEETFPDTIEVNYKGDEEVVSYWGTYVIPFAEFVKLENGDYQTTITSLIFTVSSGESSTKTIDLQEMLNEETEEV